jgi:hypothetical protein
LALLFRSAGFFQFRGKELRGKNPAATGELCRGIPLARGFDARENANPQQYDRPNDNPVRGQMQQERAVDQPNREDREPNCVESE